MKYLSLFIFFFVVLFLSTAESDDAIHKNTYNIMEGEGYEAYQIYETRNILGLGKTPKVVVLGSYEEKPKRNKLHAGYFLLLLSKEGSDSFKKEDLILQPGDYGFTPYFFDINGDGLVDLVIHKGEEDYTSTTIYLASIKNNNLKFRKIYNNEGAYLYPFDIDGDGIPEFIEPQGNWWVEDETFAYPRVKLLTTYIQNKIVEDYSKISGNFAKYHNNKDNTSSLNMALQCGYYWNRVKVLNFKKGQTEDITKDFSSFIRMRTSLLDTILSSNNLSVDSKKRFHVNRKYFEQLLVK